MHYMSNKFTSVQLKLLINYLHVTIQRLVKKISKKQTYIKPK